MADKYQNGLIQDALGKGIILLSREEMTGCYFIVRELKPPVHCGQVCELDDGSTHEESPCDPGCEDGYQSREATAGAHSRQHSRSTNVNVAVLCRCNRVLFCL